jgi:hypothetical protein
LLHQFGAVDFVAAEITAAISSFSFSLNLHSHSSSQLSVIIMPRKRRAASPSNAVEIPNLVKRQKSENESEAKIDAGSRPASSETTSSPSHTRVRWTIGSPLPTRVIPSSFQPGSSQFQAQAIEKLDKDKELAAVRRWILSKSRPPFARLLCSEKLQKDDKLLAAYLGFNTVPGFYYFAYFDGRKLLLLIK